MHAENVDENTLKQKIDNNEKFQISHLVLVPVVYSMVFSHHTRLSGVK